MNTATPHRPSRPLQVKELAAQAERFHFNTNISFKHWFRAAETVYQEASFALSEGDYGRAYTMLYRFSLLVLQYIPTHPQYQERENKKAFKTLSRRVNSVVKDLEALKPEIEKAYEEWVATHPTSSDTAALPEHPNTFEDFAARDASLGGYTQVLDASEHQDLAVDLAQKELRRRDNARLATRQAGISGREATARRQGGLWDSVGPRSSRYDDAVDDLQRQLEATRRTLDRSSEGNAHAVEDPHTSWHKPRNEHYPSLAKSRPLDYERGHTDHFDTATPPLLPSKEPLVQAYDGPPVPAKPSSYGTDRPPLPQKVSLPTPDMHTASELQVASSPALPRKERLTFRPGAYLESGEPIRSVFIPSQLRQEFLKMAADNTRRGLEMCGILCGLPINNALFVRCLLIPDQKATPDTCETQNESALFDYCDKEDLLMIGWIHTHPTQTCFMSSRDLHTHAGYQIMMPESIAIVCAPKFQPSYGIFRLTKPPGLDHILQCTRTETFHPHAVDNLYRDAERPNGHVYESDKLPFYTHDLRSTV